MEGQTGWELDSMDFALLVLLPVVILCGSVYCGWNAWALLRGLRQGRPSTQEPHRHSGGQDRRLARRVNSALVISTSVAFVTIAVVLAVNVMKTSPFAPEWLARGDDLAAGEVVGSRFFYEPHDVPNRFSHALDRPGQPVIGASFTGPSLTDEEFVRFVREHPDLEWIHLVDTRVTDRGLKAIEGLKSLRLLVLSGLKITDSGMGSIAKLQALKDLSMCRIKVSNQGCEAIGRLEGLRELWLSGARISDAGIESFVRLRRLETLRLYGCDVSDEALARLQDALPGCDIATERGVSSTSGQ